MNTESTDLIQKLYLDSNIFLNVWFDELIKFGEKFYSSKKLLDKIIECIFSLVISDLTIRELCKKTELPSEIICEEYLKPFKIIDKLKIIKTTRKVAEDAVYLSGYYGIHKTDALHAIMVKSNDCILVTRDNELIFAAKKYGIKTVKPQDII